MNTIRYFGAYAVHLGGCLKTAALYTFDRLTEPSTWVGVASAYGSVQVLPGPLKWVGLAGSCVPIFCPGLRRGDCHGA